jgi:hypothetical protein
VSAEPLGRLEPDADARGLGELSLLLADGLELHLERRIIEGEGQADQTDLVRNLLSLEAGDPGDQGARAEDGDRLDGGLDGWARHRWIPLVGINKVSRFGDSSSTVYQEGFPEASPKIMVI